MNSKTHKIVTAIYYPPLQHFVVPIDWDIKDINVKWDNIYYKGFIKEEIPSYTEDNYEDEIIPETIDEGDWKELVNYFSCCESEEEDSSSEEEEDDFAECCRCGEDVSNDEGEGKLVDGEYWCVDCLDDKKETQSLSENGLTPSS